MTPTVRVSFLEQRLPVWAYVMAALCAAVFLFGFKAPSASAAACTFASAGTSDFNTAANWDCGFVPGSTSTAIIPAATSTSLSSSATVSGVTINSGATLTTGNFNLTVTDSVTSTSGALVSGSGTISVGNDWLFLGSASFTPGTGTVRFGTSTADGSFIGTIDVPSSISFNNFVVSSTNFVRPLGDHTYSIGGTLVVTQGTFNPLGGADVTVTGTTTVATLGILLPGSADSVFTANATTTNNGTIGGSATNTLVFNADLVNNGTIGNTTANHLGSYTIGAAWTNTGTFNAGSSTVTFTATSSQTIPSSITFFNLTINKPLSSSSATLAGNATTTGALSIAFGNFNLAGNTLNAFGNVIRTHCSVSACGTMPSATGTLYILGDANQSIRGTITDHVIVNKSAGTAAVDDLGLTTSDLTLMSGTFVHSSNALTLTGSGVPLLLLGGTFSDTGGEVDYTSIGGVTVASTTYSFLVLGGSSGGLFSLSASTTAINGFILGASGDTFAVGTNVFTAQGTYTNAGLVTVNTGGGGKIVHTAESVKITDSVGTEVSSISSDGTLYVTVQDKNRNLNGAAVETMTFPVSFNAAAGSDSETITLTETSVSSGIFRNTSAVNVVNSTVVSAGNNQFELTGSGVGTGSYTDNQDAADTGSDTVTLTYVAASAGSSGGGGGGLGSAGSPALPPLVTQFQSNLQNLQNQGIAVHSLVKLPDDKNAATQYDSAVYYIGADGKRHAFPNDKVYFTWYMDFSGVQIVNDPQLASIPLGANVTYKPGKKMVKFTTDAKVYVVAKGGVLRWVTTETAAVALYGSNWNTKIDDINDAFYANYTFGNNVTGLADFNPAQVEASVSVPSDSLQM